MTKNHLTTAFFVYTNKGVEIEFDSEKDKANQKTHGISLGEASYFDWHTAAYVLDTRKDYGEVRYIAQGYIAERLHILIFTPRESRARIISLRKSNSRERGKYEEAHH